MTIMLDNSRQPEDAFALVRAQRGSRLLFDCRNTSKPYSSIPSGLAEIANLWLDKVCGPC